MQDQTTPGYDGPVVYTIQADWGGPVKIGFCAKATGVPPRLAALQTSSPWRLVVRRVIEAPDRRVTERDLHERLAKYRLSGEWFINAPAVAMATGATLPKPRDLERALVPVLNAAYDAGVRAGRYQHEVETRRHIRFLTGLIADYFDEESCDPSDENANALELARQKLTKLMGGGRYTFEPPSRPPIGEAEAA